MTVAPVEPEVTRAELELLVQAAVRETQRACGDGAVRRAQQGVLGLATSATAVLLYDAVLLLRGLG